MNLMLCIDPMPDSILGCIEVTFALHPQDSYRASLRECYAQSQESCRGFVVIRLEVLPHFVTQGTDRTLNLANCPRIVLSLRLLYYYVQAARLKVVFQVLHGLSIQEYNMDLRSGLLFGSIMSPAVTTYDCIKGID